MFDISLLDRPQLQLRGGLVHPLAAKDAVLLAWLALRGPAPRDQVAQWLWPCRSPAGARANLRQRIRKLQVITGGSLLDAEGQILALKPGVTHDAGNEGVLLKQLETDALAPIPSLLGSQAVVDAPEAMTWLDRERQRLRQAGLQSLRSRAQDLEDSANPDAALPFALRLVDEEPLDELEHRRLMRLHYLCGNRNAALVAYERLRLLLQKELKTAPDPQTMALAHLISEASDTPLITAAATARTQAPVARAAVPVQPAPQTAAAWAALSRPPHLLQREEAWAVLDNAWRHGGFVVVQAPPGMGKTRLLEDFARAAEDPPDRRGLLRIALRAGDAAVPFSLLCRWLEAAWQRSAHQLQQLPSWATAEMARLVPAMGTAAVGQMMPRRVLQAFCELARLEDAVLIDDFQHADSASLELLPALLDGMRAAIIAARTGELAPALLNWAQSSSSEAHRSVNMLTLEPWSQSTTARLLQGAGWTPAAAARWAAVLQQHTGGHPLAVLETVRAVLQARPGGADLPEPPDALPMPTRLLTLLQRRLQGMDEPSRQVADIASLAGSLFSPELAASVLQCTAQALDTPWRNLQAASFMSVEGQWHDLVLEAVRTSLAEPWRRQLHRGIATAAQALGCAPSRLAPHWEAGGEPARAAECHESAAHEAAKLSRVAEAGEHFRRAAEHWTSAGDACRAFEAHAQQAETSVRGVLVEQGVELARALVARADPVLPLQRAQALRVLALGLSMQFKHNEARDTARAACVAAREAQQPDWHSDTALLWALAAAYLGDAVDADAALDEVAELKASQTWQQRLTVVSTKAGICSLLGRLHLAVANLQEALELSQRPEAAAERATLHNNMAAILLRMGHREQEALEHAERSVALALQMGLEDSSAAFSGHLHVGLLSQTMGRYDQAIEAFEACLRCAERSGLHAALPLARNHYAWLWAQLGQPERAQLLLSEDRRPLSSTLSVRRWTLLDDMHVLCGSPAPPGPPPDASADTDLAVAGGLQLSLFRRLPAAERRAALPALLLHFEAHRLPGLARRARVMALAEGCGGRADLDRALALDLCDELLQGEPYSGYRPEALWTVSQVLRDLGDEERSDALLKQARGWVVRALEHVPAAMRRGFRDTNRVNRELLRYRMAGLPVQDRDPG